MALRTVLQQNNAFLHTHILIRFILKSISSELAGIFTSGFAGGITVRDGTQQRLVTLCICATWHRVDA